MLAIEPKSILMNKNLKKSTWRSAQSLTPGKTLDIILFRAVCLHVDTIPQGCNAYPVCFYPIRIEVWANLIPHGYVNRKKKPIHIGFEGTNMVMFYPNL
jgi:hypothetical protein